MADQESDALLVRRVLKGDRKSFEELVCSYQGTLFRFLYHLLRGDRDRAEELTQETFLKAYQHLRRYDSGRKFSTWLFTIARNLAIDELKRCRPLSFSSFADPEDGTSWIEDRAREEATPLTLCVENEEQLTVMEALKKLSPDGRGIIVMRYFEGLTYKDISEILGLPITTVKIRLFRAKRRLLEIMTGEKSPEEGAVLPGLTPP